MSWSKLYDMKEEDRNLLINHIKEDAENHRIIMENTRVPIIPQPPSIITASIVISQTTPLRLPTPTPPGRKSLGMRR